MDRHPGHPAIGVRIVAKQRSQALGLCPDSKWKSDLGLDGSAGEPVVIIRVPMAEADVTRSLESGLSPRTRVGRASEIPARSSDVGLTMAHKMPTGTAEGAGLCRRPARRSGSYMGDVPLEGPAGEPWEMAA